MSEAIPACRECGRPSPNGDPCETCAEVERILAMSDDEIIAESSDEELGWARGFKEGLGIGLKAAALPTWNFCPRYTAPPEDDARRKQVLLFKPADGTFYTARWVESEVMGPVWATPDGHVIFGDVFWSKLPNKPASADRSGEADETSTKIEGSAEGESPVPEGQTPNLNQGHHP